ncbi:MAG TPA: peptidoglycan-binding domain-containing protein [Reyranella sp.]|nr:peptidoglycan-binding domain-containing protein [Reyranella sp.]
MDRIGKVGGSAEVAEDSFQESMARLSVHLATRRPTHHLPDPLPPRRQFRIPWPYVLIIAIVGAGAVSYPYYRWLVQDDATPHMATQQAAAAPSAPTPVLAAVAVAPEPAAPPPPAKVQSPAPIDVAAAIPAPPQPAPPVIVPAPASTTAPPAETALSWAEIVEIQKRLSSLGINAGPIDGIVGPRTIAAAQSYEQRFGHPVTDKVDRSLLALLREEPAASSKVEARAP